MTFQEVGKKHLFMAGSRCKRAVKNGPPPRRQGLAGEQALEVDHCVCTAYAMEGGLIRARLPPHLAPTSAPLAAGAPLALQRLQRVVS